MLRVIAIVCTLFWVLVPIQLGAHPYTSGSTQTYSSTTLRCPAGYTKVGQQCQANTITCPNGTVVASGGTCPSATQTCPDGSVVLSTSPCPVAEKTCPDGSVVTSSEPCPVVEQKCSDGSIILASETCPVAEKTCPDGSVVTTVQTCPVATKTCPDGSVVLATATCPTPPVATSTCPDGTVVVANATCPVSTKTCPDGSVILSTAVCPIASAVSTLCSNGTSVPAGSTCPSATTTPTPTISSSTTTVAGSPITLKDSNGNPTTAYECPDESVVYAQTACKQVQPLSALTAPNGTWQPAPLSDGGYAQAVTDCTSEYKTNVSDLSGASFSGVTNGTVYKLLSTWTYTPTDGTSPLLVVSLQNPTGGVPITVAQSCVAGVQ